MGHMHLDSMTAWCEFVVAVTVMQVFRWALPTFKQQRLVQ